MRALPLKQWPDYLCEWADPEKGLMARPPQRRELTVFGELPGADGKLSPFYVGRSRDEHGTLLHLNPELGHPLVKPKSEKDENSQYRRWNHWWAKIAVRSGYLSPAIDPAAFAMLNDLRQRDARVDFIVDTNVLIGGVGHWLVNCFGDICDLVRTVVTDLEIQRFGDAKNWAPAKFEELETRTSYLAASRFLEYLEEQHPVWRRLDIEEETALFVASASRGPRKEPGADTLLLRAVRRSIQDQVPGLLRLFVTSDQNLARSASHDLPAGSTVAAYVNPIAQQGRYLSSIRWWPKRGRDGGVGHMSSLAAFSYEATCLCDAIRLVKSDGSFLRIRGYVEGRNQFPIDWREPKVWVEEGSETSNAAPQARVVQKLAGVEGTIRSQKQPEGSSSGSPIPVRSANPESQGWPLADRSPWLPEPTLCKARVSAPTLLDVLAAIMLAARESRSVSERVFPDTPSTARELRAFLRAVDALDANNQPGRAAPEIQEIFANNDLDALSRVLTRASEYNNLIKELSSRQASSLEALGLPERSSGALVGLARLLGQAVYDSGELVYGGAYVSRGDFLEWFMKTVESDPKGPLGGCLLADISRKALRELSMSPARLEKAIQAVMEGSPLADLEFVAGGTPEQILEEEVAVLNSKGWARRKVSADGLLGYRSVRKRK